MHSGTCAGGCIRCAGRDFCVGGADAERPGKELETRLARAKTSLSGAHDITSRTLYAALDAMLESICALPPPPIGSGMGSGSGPSR